MRRFLIALIAVTVLLASGLVVSAQTEQIHVVQPGENLYRISLRYGVSLTDLIALNQIPNPNLIFVGQQLRIPGTTGGTPTQPTPPPTPPPTQPPTGEQVTYTVVRGDTLSRIAARFGTTWQAIAAANNLANPNLIYAGQVLIISGGTVPPTQPGQPPAPPPPSTGGGFELGGHVFGFAYSDLMRNTGFTWVKKQISFNRGDNPNVAQGIINDAKSRGFKILLGVVGNTGQLAENPTQYYQDFANFVGGVAALGADGIEVWNEPNIDRQWPRGLISGAQYTQMLSAAYQVIKRANPNTLVVSGAPAPTGFYGGCSTNGCDDDRFIAAMAAAGAAQFMDCVGIHYNAGIVPPTATSGAPVGSASHYSWYYPSMVNLYSRTFPSRPLCFTEIGYLTSEGYPPLPAGFSWASGVTLANQAEWLAGAVRQARSSGRVRLFIIWNVDATGYGDDPQAGYAIVRPNGTCPACSAIAAAMR